MFASIAFESRNCGYNATTMAEDGYVNPAQLFDTPLTAFNLPTAGRLLHLRSRLRRRLPSIHSRASSTAAPGPSSSDFCSSCARNAHPQPGHSGAATSKGGGPRQRRRLPSIHSRASSTAAPGPSSSDFCSSCARNSHPQPGHSAAQARAAILHRAVHSVGVAGADE